jgi:hypothetical protein
MKKAQINLGIIFLYDHFNSQEISFMNLFIKEIINTDIIIETLIEYTTFSVLTSNDKEKFVKKINNIKL